MDMSPGPQKLISALCKLYKHATTLHHVVGQYHYILTAFLSAAFHSAGEVIVLLSSVTHRMFWLMVQWGTRFSKEVGISYFCQSFVRL